MACLEDSEPDVGIHQLNQELDVGIVTRSVTQEVERMVERVTATKNALHNVQGQVAALHGTLLDQGVNTVHALRNAFLAKVRLCEAERAISRALGAERHSVAVEQHTAKQERDAARDMASQLKLHVEILSLFQDDGLGRMQRASYSRMEESLCLLSSELAALAERHSTLQTMLSTQNKADLQEKTGPPDEKIQLEACWMLMSSTLNTLKGKKACETNLISCVTSSENQVLLSETQARFDQLCLEIKQIEEMALNNFN